MKETTKTMIGAIAVLICVMMIGGLGYQIGSTEMSKSTSEVAAEWSEVYDKGFEAGEIEGFDDGYANCWSGLAMNWLGSYGRFVGFTKRYGSIHETPWNEFVIEEKVTIAMYGGSGSKLEKAEVAEWAAKYGR